MNPKQRINRQIYLKIPARMTPSERLMKAFELSNMGKAAMKDGLRQRFPEKGETEIHELFLKRLERCHNRNY